MVYSKIRYVTTSPEKKSNVINLKLFCKVVTNQSPSEKLRKCINVPALYQYGTK